MAVSSAPQAKTPWIYLLSPALPIVAGYLPIGFAYGVLAANAGLSLFQTVLMSIIVYAGSSQLMAVALIAQGLHPLSIILTTFIVNLRHLLMSASLAGYLKRWKGVQVAAFCFELTDETFGVHSLRFEEGKTAVAPTLAINLVCQFAWALGSFVGAAAGAFIEDVRPIALDYALPAMFIALLVLQIKDRRRLWIALFSGGLSLGLWVLGMQQWNVILAAVIGAALGAGVESWQMRRS